MKLQLRSSPWLPLVGLVGLVGLIGGCLSCLSETHDSPGSGSNPTGSWGGGATVNPETSSDAGHAWCEPYSEKPPVRLYGAQDVWGASANDIWYVVADQAAGFYNTNAYPNVNGETSVIVHTYPKIVHWNGRTLCKTNLNRFFPAGDERKHQLVRSIWGSAANDVWIGGENGMLFHWDGRSWESAPSFSNGYIAQLAGNRANNLYARLAGSSTLYHWDGGQWSALQPEIIAPFQDIWIDAADQIWGIVQANNTFNEDCDVYSGDAGGNFRCRLIYGNNLTFPTRIGGFGTQPWVIFRTPPRSNRVLFLPTDDSDWTVFNLPVENVYSVRSFGPTDVWLGGKNTFVHYDGSEMFTIAAGLDRESESWIVDIAGSSSSDLWGRLGSVLGGTGGFLGDGASFRRP
jgi:hypothetical protein